MQIMIVCRRTTKDITIRNKEVTTRIETNRVDLYTETTDAITSNNVKSIYLQLCKESLNSLKLPKRYPETVY